MKMNEGSTVTLAMILMTIVMFIVVGCGDKNDPIRGDIKTSWMVGPDCDSVTIPVRHEFILECIKNGNPLADEEPEDWLTECEEIAIRLYCPEAIVEYTKKWDGEKWVVFKRVVIEPVIVDAKDDQDQEKSP